MNSSFHQSLPQQPPQPVLHPGALGSYIPGGNPPVNAHGYPSVYQSASFGQFRENIHYITLDVNIDALLDLSAAANRGDPFDHVFYLRGELMPISRQSLVYLDSFYVSTCRFDVSNIAATPSHFVMAIDAIKSIDHATSDELDNRIVIPNPILGPSMQGIGAISFERPTLIQYSYKSRPIGYLNPTRLNRFRVNITDQDGHGIFSTTHSNTTHTQPRRIIIQLMIIELGDTQNSIASFPTGTIYTH